MRISDATIRRAVMVSLPFVSAGFAWIVFALARHTLSEELDYDMSSFGTFMEAVWITALAYCAMLAAVVALAATFAMAAFAIVACETPGPRRVSRRHAG